MWMEAGKQILLALIGLSAGIAVAGGLFSFIVELGVVADFADRTHTGNKVLLYENGVALGGIIGNFIYVFRVNFPSALSAIGADRILLGIFGMLAGVFVGCWAMALAEILNVFPVFMRRARIVRYTCAFIISTALGKGIGACLFFFRGW